MLGNKAVSPMRFVEMNLSYRGMEGKSRSADFVVMEEELEDLIYEFEEALNYL
jgi:hypothetical protein